MIDIWTMLLHGFAVCLQPYNLLACAAGVIVGTLVGVLPGIGTIGAISLLLPFSYSMDTTASIIMFAGIYYGSRYGGSTTSILLNVPGETSSVVTCFDGYAMGQKGRAGAALAVSAIGSFIAGTCGVIGLTIFAPPLSQLALILGPPEYFAIAVVALIILTRLTSAEPLKSAIMLLVGAMLGTVGLDAMSGASRFTFGVSELDRGIDISIIGMGVFGIGEILSVMAAPTQQAHIPNVRFRDLYPTYEEYRRSIWPIIRGSVVGFLAGLLPGPSGTISTFASYSVEKKYSRHPEEFGHGAIEGVAGPESANNSANSATMIPLLSLGLPFCGGTAILLSGFMIHGIVPGPNLITQQPDLFWGLIASMYVGNVMLLIINYPLIGIFVQLLKTPLHILMPLVAVITLTGAYAVNNSLLDIILICAFGVAGFFLRRTGFNPAPLIIGIIIGPELEQRLIQGLIICNGDIIAMTTRPITLVLLAIALLLLIYLTGNYLKSVSQQHGKGVTK